MSASSPSSAAWCRGVAASCCEGGGGDGPRQRGILGRHVRRRGRSQPRKKKRRRLRRVRFGRAPRTTRARAEAPSELGGSRGAFWRVAAAVAPRDARERRRATRQFPPRFRPSSHLRSELQELLQFALERLVQIRVLHRPTAAVRGRRSHLNTHLAHPRFPLNACVRARREVPRRDAASESKTDRLTGRSANLFSAIDSC